MINYDKWINSLPKTHSKIDEKNNQLDHDRWVGTIPKMQTIPKKSSYSLLIKYSLTAVLFISGLFLVSVVKNDTRSLQKEINNLRASIESIRLDLYQSTLDYEVLTSPENISHLAKKNLEMNLVAYKKSQIIDLNSNENVIEKFEEKSYLKKEKSIKNKVKIKVAKKIEQKKTELKKLKKLYSEPEKIPGEFKIQIAGKIKSTQIGLKKIYDDPATIIGSVKMQRWAALQVIKAFLGIPIIPGK